MDIDSEPTSRDVWIVCPKCNEITMQNANEYPIVCCNIPGMTFGAGRCCRCLTPMERDPEKIDLCLTCQLGMMTIK